MHDDKSAASISTTSGSVSLCTPRQYSKAYVDDEAVAQHHGDGIWKGPFEEPAEWRREHRNGSATVMQPPSSTPASKDSECTCYLTILIASAMLDYPNVFRMLSLY